jgi:SAM-dependent methyltransferase
VKYKGWNPDKERGTYDLDFYEKHRKYYEAGVSHLASWLKDNLQFTTIVDVGCGVGDMLVPLLGTHECYGVDFSNGARDGLVIPKERYTDHDLTTPIGKVEHRDVVLSLEVWEHIPEEFEPTYVANLMAFTPDVLIVSCAADGQWGRHHYNCGDKAHVLQVVGAYGYEEDAELTATWAKIKKLAGFYRKNTVIFRRKQVVAQVPDRAIDLAG